MFDFLFKKKEYLSCDWLEYGIHFCYDGIFFCSEFIHGKNSMPIVSVSKNNNYDYTIFFKEKVKAKEYMRKGIIPQRCIGCNKPKMGVWSKKLQIKYMAISSVAKCNSDCIYCPNHRMRNQINKIKDVPVYDFLKKCIEKKMISPDCHIEWGGGEPTIADEFDKISYLLLNNHLIGDLGIHSSGIKFSEVIIKYIKEWSKKEYRKVMDSSKLSHGIIISVDCGSRELYKRIKSFDNFDKVWENITRYCKAQADYQSDVKVKYIVIPNINDSIEEFERFLKKAIEAKVKWVIIDLENQWFSKNINNKEELKRYIKIIKNMGKLCKEYGLKQTYYSTFCYLIDKYHDFYDSV